MGVRGQRHAQAAPYRRERPGTHSTGGWVGLRAGLDRCGKSRPHRDSIPGPSNPVGSRYTDYATRPTSHQFDRLQILFLVIFKLICNESDVYVLSVT